MGKAIEKVLLENDKSVKIFHADKNESKESIKIADFVILSVKPQDSVEVLAEIKNKINKNAVLISIMVGISLKKLAQLSGHKKVVRLMPNLGLSVGAGIGVWKGEGLSSLKKSQIKKFLNKIIENFEVKNEDAINKATALSGSGPAYFFFLAKSLEEGAKGLGFSIKEARTLVEKTFKAASLLGTEDYATLIDKVKSKGGTTEAALKVFEQQNLSRTVKKGVTAAYRRAKELSK